MTTLISVSPFFRLSLIGGPLQLGSFIHACVAFFSSYFRSFSPVINHASLVAASAYDCVACPLVQVFLRFFIPRFPASSLLRVTAYFHHPSSTLLQLRWFAESAASPSPPAIFTTIYAYSTSYGLFCCVRQCFCDSGTLFGRSSACMVRLMVVLPAFGLYLLFSKVVAALR